MSLVFPPSTRVCIDKYEHSVSGFGVCVCMSMYTKEGGKEGREGEDEERA